MRQFRPRQPPADIQIKPQEYKSDPKVSLKYDNLYARAWEYVYEQPIFDVDNNNAGPRKSQEFLIQFDFSMEEMRNTPGATHECSPEISPHTDEISDVTDTYPHMEPDVESSSEQPKSSPIYIHQNQKTNTQGSSRRHKEGEAQFTRRLFLWKAHLKYWSGTTVTPTPTRLPARSWCCQNGRKTWVLY